MDSVVQRDFLALSETRNAVFSIDFDVCLVQLRLRYGRQGLFNGGAHNKERVANNELCWARAHAVVVSR
jgi:hypothetical protein